MGDLTFERDGPIRGWLRQINQSESLVAVSSARLTNEKRGDAGNIEQASD